MDSPFTQAEYQQRIASTRLAMADQAIDLLLVSDPSNMAWLTGYDGWSFYVHQCVLLTHEGDPIWFGREQDANGARLTCFMTEANLIGYPDYYVQSTDHHPMDYLCRMLNERGLAVASIGVEMDNYWFSAKAFAQLQSHLPNTRFVDATALVNWQRVVKSERELDYMRIAAKRVEMMHARIVDVVEPGMRKCDLVAEIYDASLRFDSDTETGGDYPAIVPLLPSGANASAPHLTWDDQTLKTGEGSFFELAGVYRRYHCPLSRTVFLGRPGREFLNAEAAVQEGMAAGLEKAVAGSTCDSVATAFFSVLARYGIEKNNRAGYSIGLSYPPDWGERTLSIRSGDHTVLKRNMCIHFMTGLWMDNWGFEITESIVIGEGAPECLANVPRQLVVKQ